MCSESIACIKTDFVAGASRPRCCEEATARRRRHTDASPMLRRRTTNTLVFLSLLISTAMAGLWIRSHVRWDTVTVAWPWKGAGIGSYSGRVVLLVQLTDGFGSRIERGRQAPDSRARLLTVASPMASLVWNCGREQFVFDHFQAGYDLWVLDPAEPTAEVLKVLPGARPVVGDRFLRVHVPHWFVVSISLVPGMIWLASRVRGGVRHRLTARIGKCSNCGYDTRANIDRCSECGHLLRPQPGAAVPRGQCAT